MKMKKIGTSNLLQKKQEESLSKKQGLNLKEQKGITLIALVVTIAVLLILAGVTITFVLGEGGILEMAKEAAEKTKNSIANDQSDMTNLANQIENLLGGSTTGGSGSTGETTSPSTTPSTNPSTDTPPEGISPDEIEGKKTEFYGKTVNYTSTNNTGVTTWRIFYVGKLDDKDETEQSHIYLIADDYISLDNTPEKNGNKLSSNGCKFYWNDSLLKCYSGASDIYGNTKVRNMLKQYFAYTTSNQTSENDNIKAVAYMLDTEIWSNLYGDGEKMQNMQ